MDETSLALERLIPASPEELFELWVDPAQLSLWWAPAGYECRVDALDPRPGGRWRTSMSRPGSKAIAISGIFRAVERPRRLAFSWAWEQDDGSRGHETEVTVVFEPVTGGTRLVLVQQSFENQQARDRHTFGWSTSLDRLEQIHAGA